MKAIINKDKVTLADTEVYNSGSINYYKLDTEFDESWEGLTKEAILTQGGEGVRIPVSGNYIMIDRAISGKYDIGFIGYTLEYHLTIDTVVDPNKTYYTLQGDIYVVVANPVIADIGTYYEATKDFQVSTNLVQIYFAVGAGQINSNDTDKF